MGETARVRQVIEMHFHRGDGTVENTHRIVTRYLDLDGTVLAEYDPCALDGTLRKPDGTLSPQSPIQEDAS